VREGFLLFKGSREILLQHIHLQKFTNLSGHSCSFASRFLNQKFVPLYDCHSIKCCTDYPRNACQISAAAVRKTQLNKCLEKHAQHLENRAQFFFVVRPSIYVQVRMDCTDFSHLEKKMPNNLLDFYAWNGCRIALGCMSNTLRNLCFCLPRKLCTINVVRPLKSILYGLIINVVSCLVICACCLPWDAFSPPTNDISLL
jgi:hypothetical protein